MQKLTNRELNVRLAKAMGKYLGKEGDWMGDAVNVSCGVFRLEMNWCALWSDTGQLIDEYNVAISEFEAEHSAVLTNVKGVRFISTDVTIKRAIVQVVIKSLEYKEDE